MRQWIIPNANLRAFSDWGWGQAAPGSCRARGSLASLRGRRRGRRITGSGGWASQSVWRPPGRLPLGSGLSAGSPRPSSPRERRGPAPSGAETRSRSAGDGGRRALLAPAELGAVGPDAMEDDRELAGDRHAGSRHAPALGDLQAPGAQGRPLPAADQQRVGRLVERGSGELVAAAADAALHVRLAGLVALGRQAEVRA